MQIILSDIGKRFNREWIFRNLSYEFAAPKKYAVTGANGSGKSTLLQLIAGAITLTEGTMVYRNGKNELTDDTNCYQNISLAAPYLELIEEMTATELLQFHHSFKPLYLQAEEILHIVSLEKAALKPIRYYSSGMKQRLKLALAFFSNASVLLLDEPTTNLDAEGIALYLHLITQYTNNKLVIISSNDKQEYDFCDEIIAISQYKSA